MTEAGQGGERRCVFCVAEAASDDASSLTLYRGDTCFVVLNKYPYSNGHLMVAPRRHVASLTEATQNELAELIRLAQTAESVLGEAYEPHGFNVGMNLGRPAGAGVPGHLHMHVVPRWHGDTNFMTVTADTRVVPETPDQTVARLRPLFDRLA